MKFEIEMKRNEEYDMKNRIIVNENSIFDTFIFIYKIFCHLGIEKIF